MGARETEVMVVIAVQEANVRNYFGEFLHRTLA